MAGVLYTKQHVYNEKPTLDPEEFKRMIEEAEPALKVFLINFLLEPIHKQRVIQQMKKIKKGWFHYVTFWQVLITNLLMGLKQRLDIY